MRHEIKVLLVEDNPPDAAYIEELLSGDSRPAFHLKQAILLSEAQLLLDKERFDIVLLDLGLPDSQGIETGLAIRQQCPAVPVIVLTGLSDEELALKALQMDIQDYLLKGQISRDLLARSIRYAIERKLAMEELRISKERYQELFDSMDEGYCVIEMRIEPDQPLDYRFIEVNQAFENQSTLKDVKGKWMRELQPEHEESWYEIYRDVVLTGQPVRFEHGGKSLGGRWFTLYAFRIGDPEQRRVAVLFNDITCRKRMEEEIKHMAYHDALTGLPNRRLFMDIVNIGVAEARRHQTKLAILFMDLDHFKNINDTLGHEAGDQLLVETAIRLKASIRESDTVARIGGDEFNIILADVAQISDITTVAQKIMESFRKIFIVAGQEFQITTSIGISIYPDDSEDVDTLFRYADLAMYYAKEMGRNTFRFHNPEINTGSANRKKLEGMLRRSIEFDELTVHYQPQMDISTGKIVCAEALVRWNHPEEGLLESKRFITMAEEAGFVTAIDEWMLQAVCAQIRTWLDAGLAPLCFTVNLSARRFQQPDLVGRMTRLVEDHGIPAHCLNVELREELAMNNAGLTAARLKELVNMGLHITVDDFGTGKLSLESLNRLPLARLKIARSFIQDISGDADCRAIISAVISIGHSMNMKVAAVGVETEGQLSFLRQCRCDEAQGYYFSRPLPAEEFQRFITMME